MTVLLECNPDEVLAKSLGIPRKSLFHNNDKGRVCNNLETKYENSIGMVDEDPESSQPAYIAKLRFLECRHNIKVLIDSKRKNKLIIICPRLEEWILDISRKADVNVSAFGLSKISKELHRKLGSKAEKLQPLIAELLAVRSPAIHYLKEQFSSAIPGDSAK